MVSTTGIKKLSLAIMVLVLAVVVSGCFRFSQSGPATDASAPSPGRNPELERQYEQQLKTVLAPFWQTNQLTGIREQILELRAPALYLDLHLNLVLAFDAIEQGIAVGDQNQIDTGVGRITSLQTQYPWIGP